MVQPKPYIRHAALGAAAVLLSLAPLLTFSYSRTLSEYALLSLPAVAFPVATSLATHRRHRGAWAPALIVMTPLALWMLTLTLLMGVSATPLIPLVAVAGVGSVVMVLSRRLTGALQPPVGMVLRLVIAALPAALAVTLVPSTMGRLLTRVGHAQAPAVSLTLLDGSSLSTGELAGRVVVLSFWGVRCPPCVEEMPELEAVARAQRPTSDAVFVAVNPAHGGESVDDVRAFASRHGLTLPIAFDAGGTVAQAFGVDGLPTTVIVDRAGAERYRRNGYSVTAGYAAWLTRVVDELGREQPAGAARARGTSAEASSR